MDGMREEAAKFLDKAEISRQRAPHLIGTPFEGLKRFRTFGDDAPMYEVLSVGQATVRIRVFDTGEELDYRIERALEDPRAV